MTPVDSCITPQHTHTTHLTVSVSHCCDGLGLSRHTHTLSWRRSEAIPSPHLVPAGWLAAQCRLVNWPFHQINHANLSDILSKERTHTHCPPRAHTSCFNLLVLVQKYIHTYKYTNMSSTMSMWCTHNGPNA